MSLKRIDDIIPAAKNGTNGIWSLNFIFLNNNSRMAKIAPLPNAIINASIEFSNPILADPVEKNNISPIPMPFSFVRTINTLKNRRENMILLKLSNK